MNTLWSSNCFVLVLLTSPPFWISSLQLYNILKKLIPFNKTESHLDVINYLLYEFDYEATSKQRKTLLKEMETITIVLEWLLI